MIIDKEVLEVALARAITESMTKGEQDKVLAQAMHGYLFTKIRSSPYDSKEVDPLSEAFRKALDTATYQLVKDFLDEPEQKTKMRAVVEAAFAMAMTSPVATEKIAEKLLGMFSRF